MTSPASRASLRSSTPLESTLLCAPAPSRRLDAKLAALRRLQEEGLCKIAPADFGEFPFHALSGE